MRRNTIACCIASMALALGATAAVAQENTAATPPSDPAATSEQSAPAQASEPAPAAEQSAPSQESAAPEASAGSSVIGAPPEGKGHVVFFRPSRFTGGALTFTVRENGADLGRLSSGRYFVQVAEPGIHAYTIGNNDTMRMEVEEGGTYWVMENTTMGVIAGRATLVPSDRDAFEDALPHMRLWTPRP
jgi:hypothetical protein